MTVNSDFVHHLEHFQIHQFQKCDHFLSASVRERHSYSGRSIIEGGSLSLDQPYLLPHKTCLFKIGAKNCCFECQTEMELRQFSRWSD
jgi:hypothetical protein